MVKYSDTQYTSLTPNKIMNSLIYRTLFYVNICRSYKLSKNSPVFWPTLYSLVQFIEWTAKFYVFLRLLLLRSETVKCLGANPICLTIHTTILQKLKDFENLYSPCKHGRTINSTNQDTNTNQIKTKTVTERTENTWNSIQISIIFFRPPEMQ